MLLVSGIPPLQEARVRKRHIVVLSEEERARLHTMIGRGVAPAGALTHARILLKANQGEAGPGWTDAAIAAALEVSPATVARVRMKYVAAGLEAAVYRMPPARQYRRRLDGEQEARLVALTCSVPPEAHKRWTLLLLAGRLVELEVVDAISYETVRQALKQPPQAVADPAPVHPARARRRVRLVHGGRAGGLHPPVGPAPSAGVPGRDQPPAAGRGDPAAAGRARPAGQAGLRVRAPRSVQPVPGLRATCWLAGRHGQRPGTRIDWAHCVKDLVDVHYPDAERIVLVQDNLNTHTPASLYEAFPPAEAKRLAEPLELHYTPKHGSWLNMAEIELAVLARQCLDRRLADQATLEREVAAWQEARSRAGRGVDWRFTTEDARIKLKHLYPPIQL